MKKLLSLLLALVVLCSLCACTEVGGADTPGDSSAPIDSTDIDPAVSDSTDAPPPVSDSTATDTGTHPAPDVPFTVTPVRSSSTQYFFTQFILEYNGELIEFSGNHIEDPTLGSIQNHYIDMTGDGQEDLVVFLVPGGGSGYVKHEIHVFDGVTLEEYDTTNLWSLALDPYTFHREDDTYFISAHDEVIGCFTKADVLGQWYDNPGYSTFLFQDTVSLLGEYRYAGVKDGQLCVTALCFVGDYWQSYGQVESRLALVDGALTVTQTAYIAPDNTEELTVVFSNLEDGITLYSHAGIDTLLYGDYTQSFPDFGEGITDLRVVDLDGDGEDEVAITGWVAAGSSVFSHLHLLKHQEDGTWNAHTFCTCSGHENGQPLEISVESAVLTAGGNTVTAELAGLTHSLTVSEEIAAREGDYSLSSIGTNRIIRWIDDQPYLHLSGRLCKGDGQSLSGDCGTGCELVCRLGYQDSRFTVTPVSLHSLATVYTPFYETIGKEMCDIRGYDADVLSYIIDTRSLYFASPRFLSDFFAGIVTEGSAQLDGNLVTVNFTRHDDPQSGTVYGAGIRFTVDLEHGAVITTQSEPFNGLTIELSDRDKVEIAAGLADVIRDVEHYLD